MQLTSSAFVDNGMIPVKYTCQGQDINPDLIIEGIAENTKSLALIMDDPDAPIGTWVHWVVFDIPVIGRIEENTIPGKQGKNTAGRLNYHGPCPPSGTHRYFFKIYALDSFLDLDKYATKAELESSMQGHILDQAQLVGLYKKK